MLRRRFFLLLASLTAGPGVLAQDSGFAGIDQLRLGVSDVDRSTAFYAALFGAELRTDPASGNPCIRLGQSVLWLEPATEPAGLLLGFALAGPVAARRPLLQAQGIRWQDAEDGSLQVVDRDAVRTRLGAALDWQSLSAAEPRANGKPVFAARLVDEVALNVTNMQVDSMFYARLLEQTSTAVAGSQFFSIGSHARLRLSQAAVGQATGFNYFSVLVANTDMAAAAEAVFRAGGIIENFLPNGFSFWDPDGLRVVVRTAPQVLNLSP
jgi:catechol 2,3-dioxygenase-like lactoylglutathione lyase family enzyme